MAKYLPLPDGSSVTVREGESAQQAWERAQRMYPEAFQGQAPAGGGPESGFAPALKSGFSSLKSGIAALAGRTGIMDEDAARKYIAEQEEYQKKTFKPTESFADAPFTKFNELLGGSIPQMVGPLLAGGARAFVPGASVAAPVLGGLTTLGTAVGTGAAGATSAAQFAGSNLLRQMDDGKQLGETSLSSAAAAAVPQAALDIVGFKMIPGVRQIFKAAGKEIAPAAAKQIAEQTLKETLKDYAVSTGKTLTAEGLTEAGQQVLERLQAGLDITDEKARSEYFDSFIGGAVLGGALAPAGRFFERRAEASEQKDKRLADAIRLRQEEEAQAAAKAAERQSPEGQLAFVQDYEARLAEFNDLKAQKKPGSDATPLEQVEHKERMKRKAELGKSLTQEATEYRKAKAEVANIQEQARLAAMSPEDYMLEQMGLAPKEAAPAAPTKMRTVIDEFGQISEVPEGKEPEAPATTAAQYLSTQVRAAREMGVLDLADLADFAMQNPQLAAQAVNEGASIEGLSRKDSAALLGGIRLRLKELEKQRAAGFKEEMDRRAADIKAQKLVADTTDATAQTLADFYGEKVAEGIPQVEPTFEYLDPIFEQAFNKAPTVAVPDNIKPLPDAAKRRAQVEGLMQAADQADRDAEIARGARDQLTAKMHEQRGTEAVRKLDALKAQGDPYTQAAISLRRAQNDALARLNDALEKLRGNFTLSGPDRKLAGNVEAGLEKQAADARADFITNALQEAALHRRAAGQPALTQDEAIKAASKLRDTIDTWTERSKVKGPREELTNAEKNLKPVRERVNKGGNTVRTYRLLDTETNAPVELTIIRQKDGTVFRVFSRYLDGKGGGTEFDNKYDKKISDQAIIQKSFINTEMFSLGKELPPGMQRISPSEVAHFRARIDAVRRQLLKAPQVEAKRVEGDFLKRQYAGAEAAKVAEQRGETAKTIGGELRRRREYVSNLLEKAIPKAPEGGTYEYTDARGNPIVERVEAMREVLQRAKDMIDDGNADKTLLDAAENQARRVLEGRDMGEVYRTQRALVSSKRAMENVPGKEGSTVSVRKQRKAISMATQEDAFYKAGEAEIEPDEALRELKEAIKLNERVMQENAGQKTLDLLFEEPGKPARKIENDLGYIRATPENFAKSPRIKPVWEALAKSRRAAAILKGKQESRAKRQRITLEAVKKLENLVDQISERTEFFWRNQTRFTPEEIAKALVPYPKLGQTAEEQRLVNKYLKLEKLTPEEASRVEKIVRDFRQQHLPQYEAQFKDLMRLLKEDGPVDTTSSQLAEFMLSSNKQTREAAKALQERLLPLQRTIQALKESMRGSVLLTPEQKKVQQARDKAKVRRGQFEERLHKALAVALADTEKARAELLDPLIADLRPALDSAKAKLDKEQAELDRIKKRFESVLTQEEGKDRTQLATYEAFKYEEKKAIIDDLKKDIEAQEELLNLLIEERFEEIDGARVAARAMLDSQVQYYKRLTEAAEKRLADLQGVNVLDRPGDYPFAARLAQAERDSAKKQYANAEAMKAQFEKQLAENKKEEERFLKEWGGGGIRRVDGRIEALQTKEEKAKEAELNRLLEEEDKATAKALRDAAKQAQIDELEQEYENLMLELGALPGPNDVNALKTLINAPETPDVLVREYMVKVMVLQRKAIIDGQIDAIKEGKPVKPQAAATVPSTSALAAAKPFRTGSGEGRTAPRSVEQDIDEEVKQANKIAKQILGTKAPQVKVSTKRQAKTLDPYIGLFDDYEFSRGRTTDGLTKDTLEKEISQYMGEDIFNRPDEALVDDKLRVYDSPEAFIKENPKYASKIPLDAKGFAQNGKVVLFASNIEKGHALGVLLHEIGVHVGFRNFFNEGQYNALIKLVEGWSNRKDDSVEARVGRAAKARVEAAKTPKDHVGDEMLAYAVEEALRMGVRPTGVEKNSPIQNFLRMVFDAFKKALAKFGIDTNSLTAGDLVNLAYGAAQLEIKGTWHGTGAEFDAFDHSYMSSGEGAQVYGWGTYRAQKYGVGRHYYNQELDKKIRAWRNSDAMVNWANENAPEINGVKITRGGITVTQLAQALSIPREEASVLNQGVESLLQDIAKGKKRNLSPAALVEIDLEILADNVKDSPFEYPDDYAETIERVLNKIKTGELRITAPSDNPYYKSLQRMDLETAMPDSAESRAAYQVLNHLEYGDLSGTFAEKVAQAIQHVRGIASTSVKYSTNAEYKADAQKILDGLDKMSADDFTFRTATPTPTPKPTAYLLRTIHTQPEEHYLLHDLPYSKQTKYVKDAINSLIDQFPPALRKDFVTGRGAFYSAPLAERDGGTIYNDVAFALQKAGIPEEMSDMFASEALRAEGIAGVKFLEGGSRAEGKGYFNYVDFNDLDEGALVVGKNITPVRFSGSAVEQKKDSQILLSRKPQYATPEMERVGKDASEIVARQRTWSDKIKANATGLAFETQLVDRFAGFERLAKYMDSLKGSQMLYYLRMYDQRMNFVSQAVANGAPQIVEKTRADGRKEFVLEAKEGANIKNVVQILKDAQPMVGNAEAVNELFTTYLAALRADRVGLEALNFGGKVTQAMLDRAKNTVEGNAKLFDVFKKARDEYNAYNRNMMQFLAATGAISEDLAKRLASTNDYIPFYRQQDGNAMLFIGGETPIKIGNIADQPYLQELVGGDEAILDFMTSSVQNTNMLVDMGLRNLATKNAVFELINLNAAKIVKGRPSGKDVVKFRVNGEDRYAVLDTETVTIGGQKFDTGVPADLLVKGMEGIPTQLPAVIRLMAMPAQLLRKTVTLSPLYMAKQLFRDSLAAPIISGANFTPVAGALRQLSGASKQTLESRGITGGQYMTGTTDDMAKILREIADGKSGWMMALGQFEAMGMEADALTRRAQYNSYIEQGLSEMEATLMALESMNFNKRGASPSIHWVNSMIPFFNAQIQGLNVLYKAFTGNMPFNDKLKIQQKLLLRGGMLAAASLVYAAAMGDDEAYKNATPDQKYGNWFVRLPGVDEPVRIPVPFEIGYIFKALPEALYNSMTSKHGGEEAVKAFKQILIMTVPGGSSMPTIGGVLVPVPIPQALKPAIETGLGKSFYTGRDILSAREKELLPEEQFRANTSEVAKALGKTFGISPVSLEYAVRGYTGTLGLAFLHALSLGVPKSESPESAVKRLSEYPLIGGAFQPNDAGGILNNVYERFNEDIKVRDTYKKMLVEGRNAEAAALLQRRGNEILEAELGDAFKQNMNKLTQAERAIQASNMSAEEKRKQLDVIRKIKTGLATTLREVADKTTPR